MELDLNTPLCKTSQYCMRVRLLDRDLPPVTPSFRGDLKPIKGRVCLQGNSPLDTSEMPVLFRPVDGAFKEKRLQSGLFSSATYSPVFTLHPTEEEHGGVVWEGRLLFQLSKTRPRGFSYLKKTAHLRFSLELFSPLETKEQFAQPLPWASNRECLRALPEESVLGDRLSMEATISNQVLTSAEIPPGAVFLGRVFSKIFRCFARKTFTPNINAALSDRGTSSKAVEAPTRKGAKAQGSAVVFDGLASRAVRVRQTSSSALVPSTWPSLLEMPPASQRYTNTRSDNGDSSAFHAPGSRSQGGNAAPGNPLPSPEEAEVASLLAMHAGQKRRDVEDPSQPQPSSGAEHSSPPRKRPKPTMSG